MKVERIIYIIVIIILVTLSFFQYSNNKLKDEESFKGECSKIIANNGLMNYQFRYKFKIDYDGSINDLEEIKDYEFFIDVQYEKIKKEEQEEAIYKCNDTYSKNKKMQCTRIANIEEITGNKEMWYKSYVKALEEFGYVCTLGKKQIS